MIWPKRFVEENQYLSLATSDKNGQSWISPVAYTYDTDWNLYFVSIPSSKHCQNFKHNNKAAVAIFDSRQAWGEGVGLQIEAEISEVKLKDLPKIILIYTTRKYPYTNPKLNIFKVASKFIKIFITDKQLYQFCQVTPKKVWLNDPNSETDKRVEVKLND